MMVRFSTVYYLCIPKRRVELRIWKPSTSDRASPLPDARMVLYITSLFYMSDEGTLTEGTTSEHASPR